MAIRAALVLVLLLVWTQQAQAGVYNPQPADAFGDPQETFVDDDALFAYATVDIKGGRLCVVRDTPTLTGSCDSPAWGGANTVVGIGTTYTLIAGPSLKPGTWRLVSENSDGDQTGISQPFTVARCDTCSRRLSAEVVAEWKARAAHMSSGAGVCATAAGFALKKLPGKIPANQGKSIKLPFRPPGFDFSIPNFVAVSPAGGFGGSITLSFPAPGTIIFTGAQRALEIMKQLCAVTKQMYEDIEKDPPDPDFDQVAEPSFRPIDPLGEPRMDALARSLDNQAAYGQASLTAFERYLGAVDAGSEPGVHRQAQALADNTTSLVDEMRVSVRALRDYADMLDTMPEFDEPLVADETARTFLSSLYERVREQGFKQEEIDDLTADGYSAEDIEAIRTHFEVDPAAVPIGMTFGDVMRETARQFADQIDAFDQIAREAAAVAARTNSPPEASFDAVPSSGPAPLDVTFTDTSTDADGDELTVTWQIGPFGQETGTSVQHTFMFDATYPVTETVCDRQDCTTVTGQIFVGEEPPANSDPVAGDDDVTTAIGQPTLIDVLANDSDADNDPLTVGGHSQAAHGDVFCDGFQCSYDPEPGFSGADTFEYTASDGHGGTGVGTVTVTVAAPPNEPPVGGDDFLAVRETTPGTVDVLANDTDPDGDRLEVFDWSDPAHGAVDCDSGGACTYTPDQAANDNDSFTYTMRDGRGGEATATVFVSLSADPPPPNSAPQATDDVIESEEGKPGSVDVLDNDSDPDGDPLVLTGISGSPSGSVTCQGSGSCTYTPPSGFSGNDGFDYTVSDGRGGEDAAHVSVSVTAPVASERPVAAFRTVPLGGFAPLSVSFDGSDSMDPDGEVVAWRWDFGDGEQGTGRVVGHTFDAFGDYTVTLTVTDDDGAKDSVQFGYAVQNEALLGLPMCGDEDDGTITFGCPEFDQVRDVQLFQVRGSGPVDVTFDFIFREAAFDNELAAIPVDDHAGAVGNLRPGDEGYLPAALQRARVVFPSTSNAFTADKTLTFDGGQLLMFMIAQGTTVENLLTFNPENDPAGFVLGFFTLDAINPDVADHVFAYRHETDGRTEFGWEDIQGGGGDFNDIVYTVDEHVRPLSALVTTAAADEPQSEAGAVNGYKLAVANSGPGPAVLDEVELTLPPGFDYRPGSTTGDTTSDPAVSGRTLTWSGPFVVDLGERVELELEVEVADDVGDYLAEATAAAAGFAVSPTGPTARITVVRRQRPPVAQGDRLTTDAGAPALVDVLANDSDPDGDPLALSDSTQPASGSASCTAAGVCTYTPRQGFSGSDSFSYTVSDDRGGSASAGVEVTVRPPPGAGGAGGGGGGDDDEPNPNVTDGCVNFEEGVAGRRLGLARLGRTQDEHRALFQGARLNTRPGTDRYCIAGGGTLRIGYPTPRLQRGLPRRMRRSLEGRAVLILTTSRRYEVGGIGPGMKVRDLRRRLHPDRKRRVGRNLWYLARGRGVRLLFRTRGGRVHEVGIGHAGLTRTPGQIRNFLGAWNLSG